MTQPVLLVFDAAMQAHNPTGWDPARPEWTAAIKAMLEAQYPDKNTDEFSHPERPGRLAAILEKLEGDPIAEVQWQLPAAATAEALKRVHSDQHVNFIESLAGQARWLDIDTTAVSADSVAAAKLAAGAGMTAFDALVSGQADRAFCLIRPPGHHALAERAMGFCLFNNVAVTAAYARAQGVERVMIWDWDLHHGNGTQEIFYTDPSVLFVDTHCEAPFYPGTGSLEEIGSGPGTGFTLNVPLPAGSGNAALIEAADRILWPAAAAFKPQLLLISAGFDGHHLDGSFSMDETGFFAIAAKMCSLADEFCEGRLIALLEGGYSGEALATSAHATIHALNGNRLPDVNVLPEDPGPEVVAAAATYLGQHAAVFNG